MFTRQPHHQQDSFCLTRAPYRNGRKLRAVKVFTIAQESKYLLVQRLPSIAGALEQLLGHVQQYGMIDQHFRMDDYPSDDDPQFFDTVLLRFVRLDQARRCKHFCDELNFLGSTLHICYAPECETLDDLREKLQLRRSEGREQSTRAVDEVRTRMRNAFNQSQLTRFVLEAPPVKTKRKRIDL
jgi:RNA-binding protein 48